MTTFRICYAAGLLIWLISGIIYGFEEIFLWLIWLSILVVIAEIAAKLTRKKYK